MTPYNEENWVIIEYHFEWADSRRIHVYMNIMPRFGRQHDPKTNCWCSPEFDDDGYLIHNAIH